MALKVWLSSGRNQKQSSDGGGQNEDAPAETGDTDTTITSDSH